MTIREARFHKKLNQYDLALKTNLSQTKISLIERGYVQPSEDEQRRLADALGVQDIELAARSN